MNSTVQSILSILMMINGIIYLIIYAERRKTNTHKEIDYKIIFFGITACIAIPLFLSVF